VPPAPLSLDVGTLGVKAKQKTVNPQRNHSQYRWQTLKKIENYTFNITN